VTDVTVIPVQYPEDCCPTGWRWKYDCWEAALRRDAGQKWWQLRCFAHELVDHRWFETFIIVMIVGSSVALVSLIGFISVFIRSFLTFSLRSRSVQFCSLKP